MNIQDIGKNHYNNVKYSDKNLIIFAFHYLHLLEAANINDIYTDRIALLRAILLPFNSKKLEIKTERGLLKGKTTLVDQLLERLLIDTREQHRLVIYVDHGTKNAMYQTIFPNGMKPFNQMTKETIRTELSFLIEMGTTYEAQLGPNFKTVFTNYKNDFVNLREDQQDTIADRSIDIEAKDTLREAFTIELTRQYLLFCSENVGNLDLILKFFKFSIFTLNQHHHKNYEEITAEIGINETLMLSDSMKYTDKLEIISYCDHSVTICGGNDAESTCTGGIEITARETVKVNFSSIANVGDTFMKGTNPSTTDTAKIIVRVSN